MHSSKPLSAANTAHHRKPIGIFDSGIGGLTVMSEVMRLLPREDIVYFGDTAHVPYGSKSKEAVTGFSREIASFLISLDVKLIIVACNTASAFALSALRKELKVPVLGVIEPGAKAAYETTRNGRVGVIGTEGTIRSASYTKAIRALDSKSRVYSKACPLLVPLVEEGWLSHPVTLQVIREYLKPLLATSIDTIVLGCTHYPLLTSALRKAAGSRIALIDSATATAHAASALLERSGLSSGKNARRKARYRFFVSDAPEKFKMVGQKFLGDRIAAVKRVDLGSGEERP